MTPRTEELIGRFGCAVRQHDCSPWRLTCVQIGRCRTPHVEDGSMAKQNLFELCWSDLEGIDLDHFLNPVDKMHPTIGLDPPDVAGAQPSVSKALVSALAGR